jgi:geranylgeranyl pyrophosphate synthase
MFLFCGIRVAHLFSVLSGGKRFRPTLTYTVAQSFGVNLDLADGCACAVELIHVYSLIHDVG